jgi:ABC-type cobalamin/Fe3+-siderophores transport system ATPase subunit
LEKSTSSLDLKAFGVQEMKTREMKQSDGGSFLLLFIISALVTAAAVILTNNGGHDPDCPPQTV